MPDDKPNTPNSETPPTVEELLDLLEQFKQRIEILNQTSADLRSQLSAALAVNYTPLLRFGAGTNTCILNARSVQSLKLQEGVTLSHPPMPSGRWRVMADDCPASEYLEPETALLRLRLIEKQWIEALAPPE